MVTDWQGFSVVTDAFMVVSDRECCIYVCVELRLVFYDLYIHLVGVHVIILWQHSMVQGLIQKDKLHIDHKEGAQISNLANKIETQWWSNIIIKESLTNYTLHVSFCFLVMMFTLCCWFDQKTRIALKWQFQFYLRLNLDAPK